MEVFTPEEAAEVLKVHVNTIYKLLRDGSLPAVKVGRDWRISGKVLAEFIQGDLEKKQGVQFLGPDHESRFRNMVEKSRGKEEDRERRSLFFLLSSELLIDKDLYDFDDDLIKPQALETEDFTHGQRAMTELAFSLYGFRSEEPWSIVDIFKYMDEDNRSIALEAIKIRFGME